MLEQYKKQVADWNRDAIVAQAARSANAFEIAANICNQRRDPLVEAMKKRAERIMRAATRPGDPDQGDLFLDYLREQDRLEECR